MATGSAPLSLRWGELGSRRIPGGLILSVGCRRSLCQVPRRLGPWLPLPSPLSSLFSVLASLPLSLLSVPLSPSFSFSALLFSCSPLSLPRPVLSLFELIKSQEQVGKYYIRDRGKEGFGFRSLSSCYGKSRAERCEHHQYHGVQVTHMLPTLRDPTNHTIPPPGCRNRMSGKESRVAP